MAKDIFMKKIEKNDTKSMLEIITVIFCMILVVGISTFFKACPRKEDGTWMACHSVQIHLLWIGTFLILLSMVAFFVKILVVNLCLCILRLILTCLGALLPGFSTMCMMDTMRCHSVMTPFVRIMCVLISLVMLIRVINEIRDIRYQKK